MRLKMRHRRIEGSCHGDMARRVLCRLCVACLYVRGRLVVNSRGVQAAGSGASTASARPTSPSAMLLLVLLLHAACVPLPPDTAAAAVARVRNGSTTEDALCGMLGPVGCANFCTSLSSDVCWNHYLSTLAVALDSLSIWLLLQSVHSMCVKAAEGPVACHNWALLEPLAAASRLDALCDASCDWSTGMPAEAVALVLKSAAMHGLEELASSPPASPPSFEPPGPSEAPPALVPRATALSPRLKRAYCSRRFDGSYCHEHVHERAHAYAAAPTEGAPDACHRMRDGCADYDRASLLGRCVGGPAAECIAEWDRQLAACLEAHHWTARRRQLAAGAEEQGAGEQGAGEQGAGEQGAGTSLHSAYAAAGSSVELLPPEIDLEPRGAVPPSEVWSFLSRSLDSAPMPSTPVDDAGAEAAVAFDRVLYNVSLRLGIAAEATPHTVSGLMAQPTGEAGRLAVRGVVIVFQGTMAPSDAPLSDAPVIQTPTSARGAGVQGSQGSASSTRPRLASSSHGLMATLASLGYLVLAPDGIGVWSGGGGAAPAQAHMHYRTLSLVAVEMLRGALAWLLRSPGRLRARRRPEVWPMCICICMCVRTCTT